MKIEVSIGEVVDKLTILDIKQGKIVDPEKFNNIKREYDYLSSELSNNGFYQDSPYYRELYNINLQLWEVEDELRDLERKNHFEGYFIELARKVYKTNDKRAQIKRQINIEYKSTFVEEKSYAQY
jgi:hypothetical protein